MHDSKAMNGRIKKFFQVMHNKFVYSGYKAIQDIHVLSVIWGVHLYRLCMPCMSERSSSTYRLMLLGFKQDFAEHEGRAGHNILVMQVMSPYRL